MISSCWKATLDEPRLSELGHGQRNQLNEHDMFKMKLRSGTWIETGLEDSLGPSTGHSKCDLWSNKLMPQISISNLSPRCSSTANYNCNYSYKDLVKRVLHLNSITRCFQDPDDGVKTRSSSGAEPNDHVSLS